MLEGLDKIDWKSLHHAYGEADDVPELIKQMALERPLSEIEFDDPLDFEYDSTASYTLFNRVFHQGTIYEATSYVVPFLLELLTYNSFQNKADTLEALADLARNSNYYISQQGNAKNLTEKQLYKKRVYQAVADGIELYLKFLNHDDWHVRNQVAELLSLLKEYSSIIIPQLRARLDIEEETQVKDTIKASLEELNKPSHN